MAAGRLCYNADMRADWPARAEMKGETPDMKHFRISALALAAGGSLATSPLFWSLPTAILSSAGAAAGIALINSFANLAGFISPYMIGLIKDATQSTNAAMFVLAGVLLFGAFLTYTVPDKLVNK